jgi:hypoxanthine phosphoribosyltransferase
MSTPGSAPRRDVLEVDWTLFGELCRGLALRVAKDFQPDLVLGVAKAGVIPGAVIASILQCQFDAITVTRQQPGDKPVLVSQPSSRIAGARVLIVDETCDTGHTLKLALSEVRALHPAEVRTAVSICTGSYQPDFHSFETEKLIILPWDREIIVDGELVTRPDYVSWLNGLG